MRAVGKGSNGWLYLGRFALGMLVWAAGVGGFSGPSSMKLATLNLGAGIVGPVGARPRLSPAAALKRKGRSNLTRALDLSEGAFGSVARAPSFDLYEGETRLRHTRGFGKEGGGGRKDGRSPDFEANVGKVIETLRHDYPRVFFKPMDYVIYTPDVKMYDPAGVVLAGLQTYEHFFMILRVLRLLLVDRVATTFQLSYDWSRQQVRVKWHLVLDMRAQQRPVHIDGISVYHINNFGLVRRHDIETMVVNNKPADPPFSFARINNLPRWLSQPGGMGRRRDREASPAGTVSVARLFGVEGFRAVTETLAAALRSSLEGVAEAAAGEGRVGTGVGAGLPSPVHGTGGALVLAEGGRRPATIASATTVGMERMGDVMQTGGRGMTGLSGVEGLALAATGGMGGEPNQGMGSEGGGRGGGEWGGRTRETGVAAAVKDEDNDGGNGKKEKEGEEKKKKKSWWPITDVPFGCETSFDCSRGEICCDFGVVKICCTNGVKIPAFGNLAPALIPARVLDLPSD